ncbi:MAG TPA: BTAD domain-containing putative transcriptional regulator [Solirubrobacteraceae bacterium]|nr:BTAD domain-containing putative transcriptional regulator [Solirubrobacteraceae bacterium]
MGDEPRGLLQFRMLGPLEAWRDGTPLRLGGERQRALLALLLMHANELVRTEQLVDQLLGEELSNQALNTTRVAVSRLRRLLDDGDPGELLLTQAGGYVLKAGPEQLDAACFERLLSEGRGLLAGGDAASAGARLREGLALWRGPPLADLALLEFAQPEIRRLEELRLLAFMERIDADLTLGADSELIPELEGLVASNPLQERLRAQLMLALYRAGRQAEALEVYRQVSELLREELGLEPSRGLQELERGMLRQDPTLELEPGAVTTAPSAIEELAVCPYKGLASFDRSDAEYFCGRERMVSDLVARLAESMLVGIVGPSGIGKSSLLRAGVLSMLGAGALPGSAGWRQVLLRPGERPCAELSRALGGEELDVVLAGVTPSDRLVVAVDQLEELFTVCEHEGERVAFLDQLAAAACDTERRLLIVVALRADFYGRCATYTRFAELLSSSHALVGPMSRQELARAIELPAARAGLEVERALVEDLVGDVAGEPGGLPLLSTMLLELWRMRDGRVLKAERYAASGGVRGAVARLAEDAYVRLDEPGRRVARGLLLRLAHGEDGALVRRRLPVAELERIDGATPVLAALTDARLLTVSEGEVEVSHEALLTEWPRYRAWLEEDRVGRRLHAHLTEISREWDTGGRDPGDLYRGARLTAVLDWSAQHRDELSPVEREFLRASQSASGRAARRLRAVFAGVAALLFVSLIAGVLALAQKHHATSEARVAVARQLGAEAVIEPRIDLAMLLAREAVNLDRSQQTESTLLATLLRSPAAIASFELPIGVQPIGLAMSPDGRTLVVFANNNANDTLYVYNPTTLRQQRPPIPNFNGDDDPVYSPDGSLLLLTNGADTAIDVLNAHTFRTVARLPFDRRYFETIDADNSAESLFVSPDRKTVYYAYAVTSSSGQPGPGYLDRWSLPSGRLLSSSRVSARGLVAIRLVDNGTRLIVLGDTAVQTLDARTLAPERTVPVDLPGQLGVLGAVSCCIGAAAAISPDGTSAAVGSPDGTMLFVDLSTGAIHAAAGEHTADVQSVRYSPNGRWLVSTADDDKVIVWDAKTAQPLQTLLGHAGRPTQSVFSADGGTLYTSSLDGTVIEWDLGSQRRFGRPFTTGAPPPTLSPTAPPTPPLAISPDGSKFAALTTHGDVGIFSVDTLQRMRSLRVAPDATITALAWSPDGAELAVGGDRGRLQLWEVSGAPHVVRSLDALRPTSQVPEAIQSIAFSADNRLIAASDASNNVITFASSGRIAIWRTRTGAPVITPLKVGSLTEDVAFSPDERRVAVALNDGRVLILDSSNGRRVLTIHPVQGANQGTTSVAFAPNGTLATGTAVGVVQLWNPSTGDPIGHPLLAGTAVASIAFDRSGQRFATAGGPEGGLKLWFTSSLQQDGATLDPEQGTSGNAQFTPNGQSLLSINANGQGSLWPINLAALESHACTVAGRNLTHNEWSQFVTGYKYSQVCL